MNPLFRLCDLTSEPGKSLLEATQAIGFSIDVAREGLASEFEAWSDPGELDDLKVRASAIEPDARPTCVLVIAAGTLPASTLRHVLYARLLGARVLLKCATGQEAIGEAIQAADAGVRATPFSRGNVSALRSAIDQVDTVVVLGGDASIEEIKSHVPFHKTFVGYGHRVSAAWLDAPTDAELSGIATDVLMWDQAGCLSPHVLWTGENPDDTAQRLANHLRQQEKSRPMELGPWAGRERHAAAVLGHMLGHVLSTETATVGSLHTSGFRPSPRHRFLWVLPAEERALASIMPELSTLALSGTVDLDFPSHVRLCKPGSMQRPPLRWMQDGVDPLVAMQRAS